MRRRQPGHLPARPRDATSLEPGGCEHCAAGTAAHRCGPGRRDGPQPGCPRGGGWRNSGSLTSTRRGLGLTSPGRPKGAPPAPTGQARMRTGDGEPGRHLVGTRLPAEPAHRLVSGSWSKPDARRARVGHGVQLPGQEIPRGGAAGLPGWLAPREPFRDPGAVTGCRTRCQRARRRARAPAPPGAAGCAAVAAGCPPGWRRP